MILSCEGFGGRGLARFEPEETVRLWGVLRDAFPDYRKDVVFFYRRQDDAVESRMVQEIKGNTRQSMVQIDYRKYLVANSDLNYRYFTDLLCQVFGRDHVKPVAFDVKRMRGNNVIWAFLDALGLDGSALVQEVRNISPSGPLLALLNLCNRFEVDETLSARIMNAARAHFNKVGNPPGARLLSGAERTAIMAFFEASNRDFVAAHGQGEAALQYLGAPPRMDSNNVAISEDDLFQILLRAKQA